MAEDLLPLDSYAYGEVCTWHGPATFAAPSAGDGAASQACPKCGLPVHLMPSSEAFWQQVRATDRSHPGYEAMMRWSQGKCFPDFDTMQNAWRQAMTGRD